MAASATVNMCYTHAACRSQIWLTPVWSSLQSIAKIVVTIILAQQSRIMSKATAKGQAHLVRLLIAAGKATPSPPVGPALGARGVKSMDFCKEFNARTTHIEPGVPVPTKITVQPDRTFTFVTRTPPTTWLLKRAAGLEKGPARPGHEIMGTVSLKHVYEIAKIKATDEHLKHLKLESIASTVIGTARTLGLQVVP